MATHMDDKEKHDWKLKQFSYRRKSTTIIGYTSECPDCGKRSRLYWDTGWWHFRCRYCGSNGYYA